MARPRPYRAIAYVPDVTAPNGRRRQVAGRVAACTPEGLEAWIARQTAAGNVVDRLEVHGMFDTLEPVDGPS